MRKSNKKLTPEYVLENNIQKNRGWLIHQKIGNIQNSRFDVCTKQLMFYIQKIIDQIGYRYCYRTMKQVIGTATKQQLTHST